VLRIRWAEGGGLAVAVSIDVLVASLCCVVVVIACFRFVVEGFVPSAEGGV
jgi:hypothetical protein